MNLHEELRPRFTPTSVFRVATMLGTLVAVPAPSRAARPSIENDRRPHPATTAVAVATTSQPSLPSPIRRVRRIPYPTGTTGTSDTARRSIARVLAIAGAPPPDTTAVRPPPPIAGGAIPTALTSPVPHRSAIGDPVLVELHLGRIASRTVRGYTRDGRTMVALADALGLAELPLERNGARITVRLPGTHGVAQFDARTGAASGPMFRSTRAVTLIDEIGGLYVDLATVALVLGGEVTTDDEQGSATIGGFTDLPVYTRIAREDARAAWKRRLADDSVVPYVAPQTTGWSGAVVDYDVNHMITQGTQTVGYMIGAATTVGGGTVISRVYSVTGTDPQVDLAWSRVRPGDRWLTQLRLGDALSSGPRPATLRGFLLTNAPAYRPLIVEQLPFSAPLPPNWSVDAYRAGQLIAVDSTGVNGRYSLTLPVGYGENAVSIVATGPDGEVRTFNRSFRALPNMLRAGKVEYGISAGECRLGACRERGNADLHVGITRKLTARVGTDYVRADSIGRRLTPYASVTALPLNAVSVETEIAKQTFARASLRYEPTTQSRLTADVIHYSPIPVNASTNIPSRTEWRAYGRLALGAGYAAPALEVAATSSADSINRLAQVTGGVSMHVGNSLVRPYMRAELGRSDSIVANRTFVGVEASLFPPPSLGRILDRTYLHTTVEVATNGQLQRLSADIAREIVRRLRVTGGVTWNRQTGGTTLTVGVITQLPQVRLNSQAVSDRATRQTYAQTEVGGSIVVRNDLRDPRFSAEPGLDRTGLTGVVYLDRNADGVRQSNEPAIPGAHILVAGRNVVSDSSGHFGFWGIQPFEPVTMVVDTVSLTSPEWVPLYGAITAQPRPGQYAVVQVPIIEGTTLQGHLSFPSGAVPATLGGAIPLVLTNDRTGQRRRFESFGDGTFYLAGVPAGQYTLTVDPGVLDAWGLKSEPMPITVTIGNVDRTQLRMVVQIEAKRETFAIH